MVGLSKLHSRCRSNLSGEKQVIWEQKHFCAVTKLARRTVGLFAWLFPMVFKTLILVSIRKFGENPIFQRNNRFQNFLQKLKKKISGFFGERTSAGFKRSFVLLRWTFWVQTLLPRRSYVFVKYFFEIDGNFGTVCENCTLYV